MCVGFALDGPLSAPFQDASNATLHVLFLPLHKRLRELQSYGLLARSSPTTPWFLRPYFTLLTTTDVMVYIKLES